SAARAAPDRRRDGPVDRGDAEEALLAVHDLRDPGEDAHALVRGEPVDPPPHLGKELALEPLEERGARAELLEVALERGSLSPRLLSHDPLGVAEGLLEERASL